MSSRWYLAGGLLLALSLAGNLLAAGVLLGRHMADGPLQHRPPFTRGVPEEARPALRAAFHERRATFREHMHAIREARARVAELLAAPELDEAALQDAFDRLASRTQAMQSLVHEAILAAAHDLPPEVRAQWRGEWMRRGPPH